MALLAAIEHRLEMVHKLRMPLPAPYQGSSHVLPSFVAPPTRTVVVGLWLWVSGWGLVACEREYPLEPTFCDRWCHAFSELDCVSSPADCVQECEDTKGPAACEDVRETLLACYEDAPDEKFECIVGGGLANVRVADGACQTERDALYECAAPGIGQCLTTCRIVQTELDPALLASCAVGGNSCEEICWILAQSGGSLVDASAATSDDLLVLQLGVLCALNDAGGLPPIPQ